jgi:hypothetical protein
MLVLLLLLIKLPLIKFFKFKKEVITSVSFAKSYINKNIIPISILIIIT